MLAKSEVTETPKLSAVPQGPEVQDWVMTIRDWCAVMGASLGAFMAVLDIQITNASLRDIQSALGLSVAESGWISTSYLVAEIIVIPLTAFFSHVLGLRRFMLFSAVGFIISSLLCGFAWDINSLVVFRVMQGLMGGPLIPLSFQVVLLYMSPDKKTLGMAILGLTATLAPTLGPTLGGWMTEALTWRSVFFMNLFPGIILIALIMAGLPSSRMKWNELKNIDYKSLIYLVLGLGTLSYLLEEGASHNWFSDDTLRICLLCCLVFVPIFITRQFLKKTPLLNLNLLTKWNFCLATMVTALTAACLYGGIYALSIYLSEIQNYSAMQIGSVMMWVGLPQLLVIPFLPWLMNNVNLKVLILIGISLFCFSNYLNSQLTLDYTGEQFRISLIFRAIGQPLLMIPLSAMSMASLLPSEAGAASAIFNVMRNLGGSIGIAVVGTILLMRQEMHFHNFAERFLLQDGPITEQTTLLTTHFFRGGNDYFTAKLHAGTYLAQWVSRQAVVQSFCDIFKVMYLGLAVAGLLALLLKAQAWKMDKSSSDIMH